MAKIKESEFTQLRSARRLIDQVHHNFRMRDLGGIASELQNIIEQLDEYLENCKDEVEKE